MRHGTSNNRRPRNRSHGGGHRSNNGGGNRAQVFDSNGPEVRIRGTAYQIQEKYMALAKDAASSGDTVLAESYLQHAEHYQRVINEWAPRVEQNQQSDMHHHGRQATDPASQPQPVIRQQRNPRKAQDADDLGLPESIVGTKRDAAKTELADA